MATNLGKLQVGERLKVGVRGTVADLAYFTGWTITGSLYVNGGTVIAPEIAEWYAAPNERGFIGYVAFPESALAAKGYFVGQVKASLAADTDSPEIEKFQGEIEAVP